MAMTSVHVTMGAILALGVEVESNEKRQLVGGITIRLLYPSSLFFRT